MIKKEIEAIAEQMTSELKKIRAQLKHAGNKGSSLEESFSKFLRNYLPRRLEIGCGEIIDSKGKRSGQCDIIITNEDHPMSFKPNTRNPGVFFIEGVSAVGEIKTSLDTDELISTLNASKKYKELEVMPGRGSTRFCNPSDDRFYKSPPYFLFAFESKITLMKIAETIHEYTKKNNLNAKDILDGVFVLDRGQIIDYGDGKGALQFVAPDNETKKGFIAQETNQVLFDLLVFLSINMPRILRMENLLAHYLFEKNNIS